MMRKFIIISMVMLLFMVPFADVSYARDDTRVAAGQGGVLTDIVDAVNEGMGQAIEAVKTAVEHIIKVFKDLKESHWAYDSINTAVEKGVVNGYPDGTFRPDDRVNVDEFIKMMIMSLTEMHPKGFRLWSNAYMEQLPYALKSSLMQTMEYFDPDDIPQTSYWADPYLDQAERMTFFKRNDLAWGGKYNVPLTREKAAYLVMALVAWFEHRENVAFAELAWESISDGGEVVYTTHVTNAILKGIMRGYPDGTFKPKGYITRAEAVTIVDRILDRSKRIPYMPDLSDKHHTSIVLPNGDTKYYVFPIREFLDVFDALAAVRDTTPGYVVDGKVHLSYYPSKESSDEHSRELQRGNYNIESPVILSLGLGSSDTDFQVNYNTSKDLTGYEQVYDAFVNALFEEKADEFNDIYMAKAKERQDTGMIQPISLVINDREVRITTVSQKGIAAHISMKRQ